MKYTPCTEIARDTPAAKHLTGEGLTRADESMNKPSERGYVILV